MNYLQAINYGNKLLKLNNLKSYNLDSELLLSKVLNYSREKILINLNDKIEKKKFTKFKRLIFRRKNNEPIAYILKKKEFWNYTFKLNNEVLIPRPETEIIVREVLNLTNNNSSKHILDVGTGSGCILLSILNERQKCYGTALDISKKAIKVAISNAKIHHLENKIKFINIDIDKFKHNKYDLIVSNPPYINTIDLKRLDKNVRIYEPIVALEAGVDGFREIKKLILKSRQLLKKNGKLIFEIGANQDIHIKKILNDNGFYIKNLKKDLSLIPRTIIATKIL